MLNGVGVVGGHRDGGLPLVMNLVHVLVQQAVMKKSMNYYIFIIIILLYSNF